jgi:hypothetical protein
MNKGVLKIGRSDILILVICMMFLSVWFFYSIKGGQEFNKLTTDGVADTAVIVRRFIGAKGNLYFEYVFSIPDQRCNGYLLINSRIGDISVGDSILVKYLPENPDDANEVIKNEDKTVVKINIK